MPVYIRIFLIVIGFCLVIGAAAFGKLYLGVNPLSKYAPDWSYWGVARTLTLFFASCFVFVGLRPNNATLKASLIEDGSIFNSRVLQFASVFLVFSITVIVLYEADILNKLVREMQPLSIFTDILLVICLLWLLSFLPMLYRLKSGHLFGVPPFYIVVIFILIIGVILMEEMSWGQHILGFSTPEYFDKNLQNETNFHNFHTYRFELAYYGVSFFLFSVLTYSRGLVIFYLPKNAAIFIPSPIFALSAVFLAGLNYETWNITFYQFIFFLGALISADLFMRNIAELRKFKIIAGVVFVLLVVSQFIFLRFGHEMVAGHELSEVKEYLISVLLLFYAVELRARFLGKSVNS